MVVHHPSLPHELWVAIDPRRTPLVLREAGLHLNQGSSRARPCSNILSHEAAQEPTFFFRVLVRPMQSALLPSSLWVDGFMS